MHEQVNSTEHTSVPFSPPLRQYLLLIFYEGHSNRCEVYLTVVLIWISLMTNDIVYPFARVTGRKARGLQMEEIGCKCQDIFYLSLNLQEETN